MVGEFKERRGETAAGSRLVVELDWFGQSGVSKSCGLVTLITWEFQNDNDIWEGVDE